MKKQVNKMSLAEFKKEFKGFVKIFHMGGTLVECLLYNLETKKTAKFIVEDYDDMYGHGFITGGYDLEVLEYIRRMPINMEARRHHAIHVLGRIAEGARVKVVKGRKYPKGMVGVVERIYTYRVPNTRKEIDYAVLNNGAKINIKNLELVL